MVLLGTTLNNWNEFDGWCATNNIEPLEMPSRRYFSAAWRWLCEGLDQEGYDKLFNDIEQSVYEAHGALKRIQVQKEKELEAAKTKEEKTEEEGKKIIPISKFNAPPGWTPPGWSDEAAYRNSLGGMMGVTNTGGGKIGGSVKKKPGE